MMQLRTAVLVTAIAAVLRTSSSVAVAAEVRVDVPFGFVVHDKALPAGTHHLSITRGIVVIRTRGDGAVVLANPVASDRDTGAQLAFRRSEGKRVLERVWMARVRHDLTTSRAQHDRMTTGRRNADAQSGEWVTVPAL